MSKLALLSAVFFFSAFSSLQAEKIVQCITNFPIDPQVYTQALKERGYDGRVVIVDIKDYDEDLLIRKGCFHKLLRKFNLDFPACAHVPDNVEKIVFFNISRKIVKNYDLSRLPKEKLVLFMWEPRTVLRHMYKPKVHSFFSKIYTWDDALVDDKTYFKFYYPVLAPMVEGIPSFEEKKLCTLVASNLHSKVENELYSQRKEVVRYFEDAKEAGFEFYGRKWDPALYESYKGEIPGGTPGKLETIKNYRFSICYENTHGTPGYISEKIFDCFAAGTIPVYWGASNIQNFIPKDCFIDYRDFENMKALHLFMRSMSKSEYEGYLTRSKTFLQSAEAKKFTYDNLVEDFYEAVVK
ncbi:MAG: hypothetical protein JSS60_04375 [Verrucomicrobia bacterium]|nr:hypothetical protein [Verrucomicrobiota bacterium]